MSTTLPVQQFFSMTEFDFDIEHELEAEEQFYQDQSNYCDEDENMEIVSYVETLLEEEKKSNINELQKKDQDLSNNTLTNNQYNPSISSPPSLSSSKLVSDQITPDSFLSTSVHNEYFLNDNKSSTKEKEKRLNPERSQSSLQSFSSYSSFVTQLPSFHSVDSKRYLKDRPALGEECQSVTLPNGQRKYLYHRKSELKSTLSNHESLLSKPIEELLREAERNKITALSTANGNTLDGARELFLGDSSSSKSLLKSQLWVDKYAPKSFSQLLSPEKLNREVLRSIKMWDHYVFDRDVSQYNLKSDYQQHTSESNNKLESTLSSSSATPLDEEMIHQSDLHRKDKRPYYKVLLLAGPPGTGKTTLAHIVANHCGYRSIEMNASDDRSVDALKEIISRSMANNTLNSFTDKGINHPNCLILDEIDGMDGRGPIDALVSIINTPLQSNDNKKKVKGRIALTRPLICICNDQYSPILKELRAVAKIFTFSPPTEIRLVQRLKYICQNEGLGNISTTALTALCQSCNLDIRSAINTLQFASLKCSQIHLKSSSGQSSETPVDYSYEVNHILTSMLLSGSKDERQDIFKLWRNIFTVHDTDLATKRMSLLSAVQHTNSSSHHLHSSASSPSHSTTASSRTLVVPRNYQTYRSSNAMEIFESVATYSDNQLVMLGMQENYLSIRYTDPTIQRTSQAADWLSIGDIFEGKLYSGEMGSHSTSIYIPTIASAIHLLCATDSKAQKLQFPSKDRSHHFLKSQRENILQNFYDGCVMNIHSLSSRQISALDVIPLLMEIISLSGAVTVRSGSLHMLTPVEINRIKEVAQIMASYGLQFEKQTQARSNKSFNETGDTFHLEPAIDIFSSYEFHDHEKKRHPLSNESKLNLFLEIRSLLLRKVHDQHNVDTSQNQSNEAAPQGTKRISDTPETSSTSNKKSKLIGNLPFLVKSKQDLSSTTPATTTTIPTTATTTPNYFNQKKTENHKIKQSGVRFKFNQGFTNAVKRPVKISEFLSSTSSLAASSSSSSSSADHHK